MPKSFEHDSHTYKDSDPPFMFTARFRDLGDYVKLSVANAKITQVNLTDYFRQKGYALKGSAPGTGDISVITIPDRATQNQLEDSGFPSLEITLPENAWLTAFGVTEQGNKVNLDEYYGDMIMYCLNYKDSETARRVGDGQEKEDIASTLQSLLLGGFDIRKITLVDVKTADYQGTASSRPTEFREITLTGARLPPPSDVQQDIPKR